jgi:hypothetical protein
VLRPPLEGRDMVEFPPPNLSQTSDVGEQFQFDRLSLSDGFSPGNTGTSRPSSGGYHNSSRSRPHNHQKQPSPSVTGARRSLSDNMTQVSVNAQGHPLPPPQRHTGGYYSQSSSTSSQGSVKSGGGGGQLQGAWATPGTSGATVVKSGSISRNLSLNRDLSLSPRVLGGGGGGGGSSCGTASPMFSLSHFSSASSLTSSGSVTPASSGTRTPVTSQPRGSHYALISSSASKLEKMKREEHNMAAMPSQHYGRNGGGRGREGGGYPLKHSVSGPELPDTPSRRWKRTQSQQTLYRENDSLRVNAPPRRNMSSQNFQQMRGRERSRPGGGVSRPLSEEYDSGAQHPALTGDHGSGELQPRSYSDSQSRRSPGGVRRWNQPSQSGKSGYHHQKGHQSSRGRGATGRGNRGRGREK